MIVSLNDNPPNFSVYVALMFVFCCLVLASISCDEFTVTDWSNRKIDNIDSHLRDTKRNDEIESFHSEECLSIRETTSKTHNRDQLVSQKAKFDHGNNFRYAHPRGKKQVYGLKSQIEKQGMVYEDSDDQWISSLNSPSKFADSIFVTYRHYFVENIRIALSPCP